MAVPEPDELYNYLDARDAAALYSPEVMRAEFGIPGDAYDQANAYIEGGELMAAVPIEGYAGRAEAVAFGRNDSLNQYDPRTYRNMAVDPVNPAFGLRGPAELSEVPTATSNPSRPRTVAAGYDPRRAILTLVFRDGTFYNYYEVTPDTWRQFRSLGSKGQFIADSLDDHPRGAASTSDIQPEVLQAIYQVARTAQTRWGGQRATTVTKGFGVSKAMPKPAAPPRRPTKGLGKNPWTPKAPRPKKRK